MTDPTLTPDAAPEIGRVAMLEWSGPHGLSIGGSHRGVHAPSQIGYWVHDTLKEGRARFKVVRMGVIAPVGSRATLLQAKNLAQSNFEQSVLSATPAIRDQAFEEAGEPWLEQAARAISEELDTEEFDDLHPAEQVKRYNAAKRIRALKGAPPSPIEDGRVPSEPGSTRSAPEAPAGDDPDAQEEWRAVIGYEGLYEVSSLGRVRSRHAVPSRVLSPTTDKDGYPTINLYAPDGRSTFNVHRLVATAFHGDKRNVQDCEVAHLDGTRTNCRADNLAWVSKRENHSHKRLHGTHQAGEKHPSARLTEEAAAEIRASSGPRAAMAAKYGISKDTVTGIRRGRSWKVEDDSAGRRHRPDGHTLPATDPPDFEYPGPHDDLGPVIGGSDQ